MHRRRTADFLSFPGHRGPPFIDEAAFPLMRKLLKEARVCVETKLLVTDKLRSYGSALRQLQLTCPHEQGLRKNNHAEIALRIRISRCGDESARCSGSNRLDPPSAS